MITTQVLADGAVVLTQALCYRTKFWVKNSQFWKSFRSYKKFSKPLSLCLFPFGFCGIGHHFEIFKEPMQVALKKGEFLNKYKIYVVQVYVGQNKLN